MPEANEPIRKYFMPASFDERSRLLLPAIMYREIESISMPRNSITKLLYPVTMTAPQSVNRKENQQPAESHGKIIKTKHVVVIADVCIPSQGVPNQNGEQSENDQGSQYFPAVENLCGEAKQS